MRLIIKSHSTMKYLFVLYSLILGFSLQANLYGQSAIEVRGTIKSKQGAVQGAVVEFFDPNNEFQGNCISGPTGKFISEKKMAIGIALKIKVNASAYQSVEKNIRVNTNGEAGEFMLERRNLIITGFVRDSISEQALTGVEVFFYDDQGKLIQSRSTNSMGYYEVETDFVYGQKITIRVAKKDYYDDKEQTQTFTSQGINRLPDIMLPDLGARGLRAFIRIKDKKNGSPLGGGVVRYFDKRKSSYIDATVPANGEIELRLYQRPGTTLDLQVSKSKYRTFELKAILSEEPLNNVFTCALSRGN